MEENLKQLLLKDLCARLPYGVIVKYWSREGDGDVKLGFGNIGYVFQLGNGWWKKCKPYLRPMLSMTEEEFKEVTEIDRKRMIFSARHLTWHIDGEVIDFFNRKMLDWRGLIPMGLALEAKEGMYK